MDEGLKEVRKSLKKIAAAGVDAHEDTTRQC